MFTNTKGLTNDQMMKYCPSIYAASAHESRSMRYLYIPTITILDGLRGEGFIPTGVMEAKARKEDKRGYTKHLIRLRREQDLGNVQPEVHEIVLMNSHDGSTAYQLMSGFFRLVCTNGCITGQIENTEKVYHKGNDLAEVIAATYRIVEEAESVMNSIEEMKSIQLTRGEQLLLSEVSMKARFDTDEENVVEGSIEPVNKVPYLPQDFLQVHRFEDRKPDLYTTSQVIQENAIKGGVSRRDNQGRRHTTREVKGVDQTVRLNKLLWRLAQGMKELKG